jgi:hypothetical protein
MGFLSWFYVEAKAFELTVAGAGISSSLGQKETRVFPSYVIEYDECCLAGNYGGGAGS